METEFNNITLDLDKKQTGKIKVHTQIINDLSSGIYSSPATCIKELVNNSYDADAKLVTIRVKPIQDSITILDDGHGMNAEDFDGDFAWISKSNKRKENQYSENLNRPLIGKIGIGFIAVNEICDELEITSSKVGEPIKFTANVNFKDYFDRAIQEEENEQNEDWHKGIIKAEYILVNEKEEKDKHYTVIRLLGLKHTVKKILDDKLYYAEKLSKERRHYHKSYFKSMKELLEHHYKKHLRSFSDDNEYIKFILDLASFIPVKYVDGGPIESAGDQTFNSIVKDQKDLKFEVDMDGIFLRKPTFFPDQKKVSTDYVSFKGIIKVEPDPMEDEEEEDNTIEYTGYFYVQNKILYPRELNGVSLRIRGIPIAAHYGYDFTFLQYPTYMNQIFRNWISGEIYVSKGLEQAMNINRASFRVTHPHYLAMQDELHRLLDSKVFPLTLELYETGRSSRDRKKSADRKKTTKKILNTGKIKIQAKKHVPKVEESSSEAKERILAPIHIVKSSAKESVIEVDESISKKFKKRDWEYLEEIFIIFEYAYKQSKGDAKKLRQIFYKKIAEWKNVE